MKQISPLKALEKAVEVAGGQSALAARIGKKQQHVWHWLKKSEQCPPEQAIPISRAVEGTVTPHELRPDIYPEAAQ